MTGNPLCIIPRAARPEFGRWRVCRPWWVHTDTIGPPLLIDRSNGHMRPYVHTGLYRTEWEAQWHAEWLREQERIVRQRLRRLYRLRRDGRLTNRDMRRPLREFVPLAAAGLFGTETAKSLQLFEAVVHGGQATTALDSNYVAGTSGDCIGVRYLSLATKTLDTVYFYVSSYTGTAANVNDLSLELRPEATVGAILPHTSTLTESKTKDPASGTGWLTSTGWTSSLTALARWFVLVGDADGNGTDYATLAHRTAALLDWFNLTTAQHVPRFASVTTTGGWASGNSFNTLPAQIVLKFSDSSAIGMPFTANTAPASDTNRRGLRITSSAFVSPLSIYGMLWTSASASISGMEIWTGDTGPSGTADNVSTELLYGSTAAARIGCLTLNGTSYSISAATAYSIVATHSASNAGGPQRIDIGTGEDATLRAAMPGGGNLYYRRANGTTDWSNDLVGSMPAIALLLDGQVAAAGGGVYLQGGMVGGFRG